MPVTNSRLLRTMRRHILGVAAAVVVSIAAATPQASAGLLHDAMLDEARFVELINGERTRAGLPALRIVPELVSVGRTWSAEMIARGPGSNPCAVVHNPDLAAKVTLPWQRLGENVGCGNVAPDSLHARFMNSPAHQRNIMEPSFDSIGVAVVYDGDVMYVTEQFMDSQQIAPATAPNELANRTPAKAKPPTRKIRRV